MQRENSKDFGVVVLTKNSSRTISQCLSYLEAARPCKIAIVDGDSKDGTLNLVRSFSNRLNIVILHDKGRGLGYARDIGWKALKDLHYISMVDSDVLVDEHFFPASIALMESDKGLGALAGKLLPECEEEGLTAKFQAKNLAITLFNKEPAYPNTAPAVHTAFTMFRRDALEKVNGFSHDFSLAKEDSDISYKLRNAGYRLSLLNYYARHLETGKRFWKVNFRYGRSYVIIGKRYPEYSPIWSRKNILLLAASLEPFAELVVIAWYFRRYLKEVKTTSKEAFELSIMEAARQAMRSLGMLHEVIRESF